MLYDNINNVFYLGKNKIFDFSSFIWKPTSNVPKNLTEISDKDAIRLLQLSENKIKTPVAIVGTNKPTSKQYQIAQTLGNELGKLGLTVVCGGRMGVMEAACKGVSEVGGISVGLLPEANIENANKFVTIPIATGLGFSRGFIIAASALCLIAIGGGKGTTAEIAGGLQFNKKIFIIDSEIDLPLLEKCYSTDEIIKKISKLIFNLEAEEDG